MKHRFILTVGTAGLLACNLPSVTGEAKPPDVKLAPERPREPGSPAHPVVLNSYSEKDGMVYHNGESCIVYPSDGVQRPPGQMPPSAPAPCSPLMTDPIWKECAFGTIYDKGERGCTCFVGGNPPPPQKNLERCPVHP